MDPLRPEEPVGPLGPGTGFAAAVAEVARVLRELAVGARVVVGASGGPDSAALLALTRRARPDLDVVAVHVRHGLRDDALDVAAVAAQAATVGVALEVEQVVVHAAGEGPEAAARRARHDALQAAAVGARAVLLGHTADDQAETVLLRLARGAGGRGLAGMAAWRTDRRGTPVGRPLLRLRRADVREFAASLGLAVVADPGNRDERFARTIVRERVLPDLARHAGDPVGAVARAAALLREDSDHLDALAESVLDDAVVEFGPSWSIPEHVVRDAPPAIARRLVRGLGRCVGVELAAADVDAVLRLEVGRLWEAGRIRASRGGGWLCVAPPPSGAGQDAAGRVDIGLHEAPFAGWGGGVALVPPGGRAERARLQLPAGVAPVVRRRRPGDRVATTAGRRSVQDVFVDAGVPRLVRDHIPLLALDDRVVWVPGFEADAELAAAGRAAPAAVATLVRRGPGA